MAKLIKGLNAIRTILKKAGVEDEQVARAINALSKLAKVLTPYELAKMSGHRDLRILLNTYYKEDVSDILDKIN